jgi:FixJ family two-component response regulator
MGSGRGAIAMAVSAIKNGALDFIEKPFRGSEIVARLNEAMQTPPGLAAMVRKGLAPYGSPVR